MLEYLVPELVENVKNTSPVNALTPLHVKAEINTGGKRYMMHSEANKAVIRSFSAVGIALPPLIRHIQ